ncbi:MAG: 50S ribosomal protein L13 [Berkelbacteria bacterium GW2011_GWB1_38_5]|uniref:Large ribosomal subunit protein uL13 n=2 Tax=Candidatus Berkelbacteria TaxID=1618330 RepID=A0A0G0LSJ1_9BACT|nr:MAG: 50S ribosomal protein L13 [Berkelbacteria bacterium GW2011_GWB1_38_5]KKQ90945.1 MAG: 50S ribosomal protein L13 [Berkelbacteria bacterium GW2011_GWA1_39_10]
MSKPESKKPVNLNNHPIISHEIDASGVVLGRLSTQVANFLRGKFKTDFVPYLNIGDQVKVYNASKMVFTGNKLSQKIYYHHTGYIGHLKEEKLSDMFKKNPAEVLKRSVWGMLPKNKLRKLWIKNLIIYNGDIDAK